MDPTRPAHVPAPALNTELDEEQAYELESILISDQRRLAIINGQVLRSGERLGKARLLKIEDDRVSLNVDGERQVLLLREAVLDKQQVGNNGF